MPTLLAVAGGTSPVLLQKHPKSFFGRGEIGLWIQGPQWWVRGDSLVEPLNECHEGLMTANRVVEGLQRCLLGHRDPLSITNATGWQDETPYAHAYPSGGSHSWLQF